MTEQRDLFWDIEMDGQAHSGDTTWLVPTADDDFTRKNQSYHKTYTIPRYEPNFNTDNTASPNIDITIVPIRETGVLDVIGGELWEACYYLCAYILQRTDYFVENTVLELGAGLGLPSLLIARLKSLAFHNRRSTHMSMATPLPDVCLTDNALELLEHLSTTITTMGGQDGAVVNAPLKTASDLSISGAADDVRVLIKHLDWQAYVDISDCDWTLKTRRPEELISNDGWDIVIGSALVYSPSHSSVAFVLRHFIASPRCKEIVVIQIKDRPGFDIFLLRLDSLGLKYEITDVDPHTVDIASSIQVRSDSGGGIAQTFSFSTAGTVFPAQTRARMPFDSSDVCTEEPKNSDVPTIPFRTCKSMLTTDPKAFAILRILK